MAILEAVAAGRGQLLSRAGSTGNCGEGEHEVDFPSRQMKRRYRRAVEKPKLE